MGNTQSSLQCLRCLRQQSIEYALLVVEACLVLHNFIIEKRLEDVEDVDFADEDAVTTEAEQLSTQSRSESLSIAQRTERGNAFRMRHLRALLASKSSRLLQRLDSLQSTSS